MGPRLRRELNRRRDPRFLITKSYRELIWGTADPWWRMPFMSCRRAGLCIAWILGLFAVALTRAETPTLVREDIFPPEPWHNHASCVVESPRGDLIVCWFHGTGERKADDVRVEGARLRRGSRQWSERFVFADTPGFPDCNPCLLVDPRGQLWLFHITITANLWESAVLKYRVSSDYHRAGAPKWHTSEVLHVKPGPEFDAAVGRALPGLATEVAARTPELSVRERREVQDYLDAFREHTTNTFYRRIGWMPRAHPVMIDSHRLVLPLYHDGFSCGLFAITDDWGSNWHVSAPVIGGGNVQPSVVARRDGSLYTLMRDNGPPPKRAMQAESKDRGETWSPVTDSILPNPGSGLEVIALRSGKWLAVGNDTEDGRHSLAVWLSADEGRTWSWKRHVELVAPGTAGFGYPSVMQAKNGEIHLTYSFSREGRSTIRHAHFPEAWALSPEP